VSCRKAAGNNSIRVLSAHAGKPYRLLQPTPDEWSVGVPFELPFDLKGYLEWLMSENWPDEESAFFDEVMQRAKCGELPPEDYKQFVSVVEGIDRENKQTLKRIEKIFRRGKFRLVPAQTP